MAHLTQTRSTPTRRALRRVVREIGKEVVLVPVVVPLWWGAWKVCDLLWGLK